MLAYIIIVWLIMLIPASFISAMIASKIFDETKGKIIFVILTIIFSLIFLGYFLLCEEYNNFIWNDGHCEICGETWQLKEVSRTYKYGKTYYWECPKCLDIIETNMNMKQLN